MALRYYIEPKTIAGEELRLEIHDSQFVGTATEIDGGPDGFRLDYEGEPTDPFFPIMASSLEFDFLVENATHETFLDEIATSREGRFHIVLKRGSGLPVYWLGYLVADQIQQRDEYYPYHTTLFAVDGIARLRDVEYRDPATNQPYSGRATLLEHMYNIIEHIGLTSVVTLPQIRFRSSLKWFDAAMNTTTDPAAQVDIDHDAFKRRDSEGNERIWSVYEVLEALARRFNARFFHENGAWCLFQVGNYTGTFQTIYNYDASQTLVSTDTVDLDVTVDYSSGTVLKRRGGVRTYLPALKRVCVDYHHITHQNRAWGLLWPTATNDYQSLPGPLYVDTLNSTQLRLQFNFTCKTFLTVTDSSYTYPVHRYWFKMYVRLNNAFWLKRHGSGTFNNITYEQPAWQVVEDYIDIVSPIITEDLDGTGVQFQFSIDTPYISTAASGGPIEIKLVLDRITQWDNTVLWDASGQTSWPAYPITTAWYTASFDWRAADNVVQVLNGGLGDNPDSETRRTCAYDSTAGNTEELYVDVFIGDGPAPFSVSRMEVNGTRTSSWKIGTTGTAYPIDELQARQIIQMRQVPMRIFQVAAIAGGFSPINRLVDGTDAYMPLRLSWSAKDDLWDGEFVKVGTAFTGEVVDPQVDVGPVPPPKVPPPIAQPGPLPQVPGQSGAEAWTFAEAMAGTSLPSDAVAASVNTTHTLTVAPVNFTWAHKGDKVKLINPYTGQAQLLTVSIDYTPGAGYLNITEDLTADYPAGSLLMMAYRYIDTGGMMPGGWVQKFENVSGDSVTITAGTLPNPGVVSEAEIDRRVHVYRGYGGGPRIFYNVPGGFTINAEFNKILFEQDLRGETVLVHVIP